MKHCRYCGAQIEDSASFCTTCGASTASVNNSNVQTAAPSQSSGNIGWVILGFFIPIVALILYFVWKDTEPQKALAVGKGGLMSVSLSYPIVGLILYLVMKDSHPDIAKACGICAIISAILVAAVIVLYIFLLVVILAFSGAAMAFLPMLLI